MNINELNDTIKKKISKEINIDEIVIEDKTYLHLKHKNFEKNKFHLKIFIKSNELSKMRKITSTKKNGTQKVEASILIPWGFIVSVAHFPGAEGFDFPSPFESHIGFE